MAGGEVKSDRGYPLSTTRENALPACFILGRINLGIPPEKKDAFFDGSNERCSIRFSVEL